MVFPGEGRGPGGEGDWAPASAGERFGLNEFNSR
jgi:hypothetical protein